jgi:hypothetical protein
MVEVVAAIVVIVAMPSNASETPQPPKKHFPGLLTGKPYFQFGASELQKATRKLQESYRTVI